MTPLALTRVIVILLLKQTSDTTATNKWSKEF